MLLTNELTASCGVLIAGAGTTGLTLACNLLASGVNVRVVDKARGPAITSRALGLMPRGVEVLDRAGALGDLEQRANPIRQVVVDLGGRQAACLRMSQTTKLKISYRRGPLAGTSAWPFRAGPPQGDRLPDLPCLRLDGTTTRLHAELGGHWALLAPSSTPPQVAQACVDRARDRLGTANVTVLTPPAERTTQIVLVRPDGHAGWCGQPSSTALDAWLTGILRQGQTRAAVGP